MTLVEAALRKGHRVAPVRRAIGSGKERRALARKTVCAEQRICAANRRRLCSSGTPNRTTHHHQPHEAQGAARQQPRDTLSRWHGGAARPPHIAIAIWMSIQHFCSTQEQGVARASTVTSWITQTDIFASGPNACSRIRCDKASHLSYLFQCRWKRSQPRRTSAPSRKSRAKASLPSAPSSPTTARSRKSSKVTACAEWLALSASTPRAKTDFSFEFVR